MAFPMLAGFYGRVPRTPDAGEDQVPVESIWSAARGGKRYCRWGSIKKHRIPRHQKFSATVGVDGTDKLVPYLNNEAANTSGKYRPAHTPSGFFAGANPKGLKHRVPGAPA